MRKKGCYHKNRPFRLLVAAALRFVQSYLNDIAHRGSISLCVGVCFFVRYAACGKAAQTGCMELEAANSLGVTPVYFLKTVEKYCALEKLSMLATSENCICSVVM